MIRRDILFNDGTPAWLLISQVQHARISGEMACAWKEKFSEEIIAAITHHDDGWLAWEAAPQLDEQGKPLSFMELALGDSLAIWDRSIAEARGFGPLAGAIVAGHFMGLARGSEQAKDPRAATWLHDTDSRRAGWLAEWQSMSPANTSRHAEQSQQMLTIADLLSLWLCCNGPLPSKQAGSKPNTEMSDRAAMVLGKYRFIPHGQTIVHGQQIDWQGSLDPWPVAMESLRLESPAAAVPAEKYRSWGELVEAARQVRLVWQLRKTLPSTAEC